MNTQPRLRHPTAAENEKNNPSLRGLGAMVAMVSGSVLNN